MSIYPDTNFLVRLYLQLPESEKGRAALITAGEPLNLTWLTEIEILNAIERSVFESASGASLRISPEVAAAAQADFRTDLEDGSIFARPPIPIATLKAQFEELTFRHTAKRGFRTYDILHVASALVLECDAFWSFDRRACELAELEGLNTN